MNTRTTDRTDARLSTLVLAVGGRDAARVDARDVAAPSGATAVVAHVFDADSYKGAVEQILGTENGQIKPDELAGQMAVTRDIADRLEVKSIDCEPRATTGSDGTGIVDIAVDVDADRVVIGGRQ